jgi:hypothetical protein
MNRSFEITIRTVANDAEQRAGQTAVFTAQRGTAPALVNGLSPVIVANISARSRFSFSAHTIIGAPGFLSPVNLVLGTPGSFRIQSTSEGDESIYDYLILVEP